MKKSSLIGHVAELSDVIRSARISADRVTQEFFRKRHYLGARDRRFISDTVYGILRNRILLEALVGRTRESLALVHFPLTIPSLAVYAAYALRINKEEMGPLLGDIESLWRMALPSVDAKGFLEGLAASPLPGLSEKDPAIRLGLLYSFPEFVTKEWVERFGETEAEELCSALNKAAPTCIRVNTLKTGVGACQSALQAEGIESIRSAITPHGVNLARRISVQAMRTYAEGMFEMQDEGSQILSLLLEVQEGATVVDACAGAGGKTLHLAALMQNQGNVIAIDVDDRRLQELRKRTARAGVTIAQGLHAKRDQALIEQLHGRADGVLIDAPCSGVGVFRRDPGAKLTLGEDVLGPMTRTQQEVLARYAPLVRPGGRVVYATCSLLRKENEDVVDRFLRSSPEFSPVPAPEILQRQGIRLDAGPLYLTLLPHRTGTDGFFAAVLQRNG